MFLGFFKKEPEPKGGNDLPRIFVSLKYHTLMEGQIKSLYDKIHALNKTGLLIGLQPYCTNSWVKQKEYLKEFNDIPVMLNVMSSDSLGEEDCLTKKLTIDQIKEAINVCNVKYLRFHEIMSYHEGKGIDFPLEYVKDVLAFSLERKIPVFWNEWDSTKYSKIKEIISDNVIVSFATNNEYMEPAEGYKLIKKFRHKGASVQSWYWWERNGRKAGYEKFMPSMLMRQHTSEAITVGCEIIQYEPMYYFIDEDWNPKNTMQEILKERF